MTDDEHVVPCAMPHCNQPAKYLMPTGEGFCTALHLEQITFATSWQAQPEDRNGMRRVTGVHYRKYPT